MPGYPKVINTRGKEEPFSREKIYRSARRAGASRDLARKITETIRRGIRPGKKTSDIFKEIKKLLSRENLESAIRFSLKEGIRKLGPTGFPFEKYIGEIFSKNGFKVSLNQKIPGFCCRYEIDFLARKGRLLYIGECKYHNLAGSRVHSNVALSNYARFLDIKKGNFLRGKRFKDLKVKSLLVTNTKFTSKTVKYSKCMGVELLGWDYPRGKGLEHIIDVGNLYPVTILPSLDRYLAKIFASRKMMLVQDLLGIDVRRFARKARAPETRLERLAAEAEILLGTWK